MSEDNVNPADLSPEEQEKFQLRKAKEQATKLGINFSPNIKLDTLNERIDEKLKELEGSEETDEAKADESASTDSQDSKPKSEPTNESASKRAARKRAEATKLVRVNVTCMNPNKKEWDGEIISVSNRVIGTVKKFVKFNTENGYHIPQVILNVLKSRQFQTFVTKTNDRGMKYREGKLVREFGIEYLEPLTQKELEELKNKQAAARGEVQ